MTTAHIARHQARAPKRGPLGFLLLHRIEWTDAHPAFGFVGAAIVGLIGATAIKVFL